MGLSYLVDTSALTRLHRPAVRDAIESRALAGDIGRPRICDLEIGFSARDGQKWELLVSALDVFIPVETSAAHVGRALQVQRLLAERSHLGRKLPDLLVAAAAEELRLTVLHYDGDFDLIAGLTGQRCEWVVPAGSVP